MHQVILLGKPNVGKSSLFNILTRKKIAIVYDERNVTRDVLAGKVKHRENTYLLQDIGGLTKEKGIFLDEVRIKIKSELKKADFALVMFDTKSVDGEDRLVSDVVRKSNIPHLVIANKCDTYKDEMQLGDIYSLGYKQIVAFSCQGMTNVNDLREKIWEQLKTITPKLEHQGDISSWKKEADFTLSIIGKPNVGKSSLLNYLLGKERSMVSDHAGTTRDSVSDFFYHQDSKIQIIDTAGIRRKNRKKEKMEEYSLKQSLGAITRCDVVLIVIDATEGLSTQDKKIASVVDTRNKGLIVAVNKWDKIKESWANYQKETRRNFPQIAHVPIVAISCKSGKNINSLIREIHLVWNSQNSKWTTSEINNLLEQAKHDNPPKHYEGGILKLYYANQVKSNPPVVQVFINKIKYLNRSYRKYLLNVFVKEKKLLGTSVKLKFTEKEKK